MRTLKMDIFLDLHPCSQSNSHRWGNMLYQCKIFFLSLWNVKILSKDKINSVLPKANIWKFLGQNHSKWNVYFHPMNHSEKWGFYFSLKLAVILILLTLWYDNTMTSPLIAMQYQNGVKKKQDSSLLFHVLHPIPENT